MSTTKKAPAAKKAVVKKAAAPAKKTAAAAKPRSDYKAGARVKVKRKDGKEYPGHVTGVETTKTGPFVHVNIGTKTIPIPIAARPVNVRGY